MKNLVLLFLLISGAALYSYTPPDSCLKMICPNDSTIIWDSVQVSYRRVPPWNPDSVRVDSCPASPTYLSKYAKKYFGIKFKSYPFNSAIPKDSIWFVSQLKDSTTKAQFQQMELLFDPIYFTREIIIEDPDSLIIINSVVIVSFEYLQNMDTVNTAFLSSIDSILLFGYFDRWKIDEMLVSADEKIKSEIILTPNPASDYIEISVRAQHAVPDNVVIYDMLGVEQCTLTPALSLKCEVVRIDVSGLPPGVYFVRVGDVVRKFVKL